MRRSASAIAGMPAARHRAEQNVPTQEYGLPLLASSGGTATDSEYQPQGWPDPSPGERAWPPQLLQVTVRGLRAAGVAGWLCGGLHQARQ